MRRSPVFQTDDLFDNPGQYVGPTCKCSDPKTEWKRQGDPWHCTICGHTIRGEKRAALKLAMGILPKPPCSDHHPRTGPVNRDGVIPYRWRCPNCGAPIGKRAWLEAHPDADVKVSR